MKKLFLILTLTLILPNFVSAANEIKEQVIEFTPNTIPEGQYAPIPNNFTGKEGPVNVRFIYSDSLSGKEGWQLWPLGVKALYANKSKIQISVTDGEIVGITYTADDKNCELYLEDDPGLPSPENPLKDLTLVYKSVGKQYIINKIIVKYRLNESSAIGSSSFAPTESSSANSSSDTVTSGSKISNGESANMTTSSSTMSGSSSSMTTGSSSSQNSKTLSSAPFDVSVPASFKLVKGLNCNVLQKPLKSAARLVYNENEYYEWSELEVASWSTATTLKRGYKIFKFNYVAPATEEQNGFYKIEGLAPGEQGAGWVSSALCKVVKPEALAPNKNFEESHDVKWITLEGQQYALVSEYWGDSDVTYFYVGKLVDGVIVCPYAFGSPNVAIYVRQGNVSRPTLVKNRDGYWEINVPASYLIDGWSFNLSKVSDEFANELIRNAKKLDNTMVFYLNDGILRGAKI